MGKMLLLLTLFGFFSWIYAEDDDEIEVIRCEKCGATPALLMEEAQKFMDEASKSNQAGNAATAEFMMKCCEAKQKIADTMVYKDEEFTLAVNKFMELIKSGNGKIISPVLDHNEKGCPYCTYKMEIILDK